MKKNYVKPEMALAVFESRDEISARGDWELNISRGVIDPYGLNSPGGFEGEYDSGGKKGGDSRGAGGTSSIGDYFGDIWGGG